MAFVSDDSLNIMVDIRLFDPVHDADRVASFYNAQGYGPIAAGRAATASIILDVLSERGVMLFVVAEQHGKIVGTLGYARTSGRRVAPDGQLFAVMFLVNPSLRAGFLVSQMFTDSFERFAGLGARSLRVEVDPTNRRAFPLYVRIGFRLIGDGRPDEYGYLELVNHLPGIAAALHPGEQPAVARPPQYNARTIRDARKQTLTSGIGRSPTGAPTITYELEIDGRAIRAVAHADTGAILSTSVDGLEIAPLAIATEEHVLGSDAEVIRPLAGGFRAVLHTADGTIRVEHAEHLGPLAVDPFPASDNIPAGIRRPATRTVTSTVEENRWVSTDGAIVRTVEFGRRTVSLKITHGTGERVTIFPWSGFRSANLTVVSSSAGSPQSARYVRGVWPRDFTDFEAAAEDVVEAEGTRATWTELATGIELEIEARSPGLWRVEGPHLAHVAAEGSLHYHYVLRMGRPAMARAAAADEGRDWSVSGEGMGRRGATEEALVQLEVNGSSLSIDPSEGVVSWRVGDVSVIEAAPPKRRVGPLDGTRASIWFALQSARSDPDHGAVWAPPDPRLTYGSDVDGWSVEPLPDSGLLLRAHARGTEPATSELVTYLALPDAEVDLWDPTEGWIGEGTRASQWRAWTERCRVRAADGVMEVESVTGRFPEVLVRRASFGLVLALFSHVEAGGVKVAWRLRSVQRRRVSDLVVRS